MSSKMKRFAFSALAALALLSLLILPVRAEQEAADVARSCTITASANKKYISRMLNPDHQKYWPCTQGDSLEIQAPAGTLVQGVMISFLGEVPQLTVRSGDRIIAAYSDCFISNYIPFSEPVSRFSIDIRQCGDKARINHLYVLSEGTLPDWVQRWKLLEEPADLMVVATHPDDELLWFGGLLPTYAGAYEKKIQLVYMVGNNPYRRNELLNGLWTCGVQYYPEIGAFPDKCGRTVKSCLSLWGENEPRQYITEMLRKHRPSVVVTQDINGEYGHAHHRVTVQAVIDAATGLSANGAWDADSAARYGLWQPHKLYLHLWPEGQLTFDWRQPLDAFHGKTSLEIARKAFKQHTSQQKGKYHILDSGRLDCRLFGLYWSDVGPDKAMNDLLEHIAP